VADVVLAGPDHLHRPAELLGQLHGIAHEVLLAAAAEAAAEEGGVHPHLD
jgi:hypothetical protein